MSERVGTGEETAECATACRKASNLGYRSVVDGGDGIEQGRQVESKMASSPT
jgi:hypothetical protein